MSTVAEIAISPDGKLTIVTRQGTFTEGAEKIAKFTESLEISGIKITAGPRIEQHRHNENHVHHNHYVGVNGRG